MCLDRIATGRQARALFLAAALLPPLLVLAILWALPIDSPGADRVAVAARDYTDMWAAGHLVNTGQQSLLFDLAGFNAALRAMFGTGFPHQVWSYPPPIMLIAVLLARIPLLPGFLLYTICTAMLLWLALRCGGLAKSACWAVLCSPAVAENALTGQNGALLAASLFAGLTMVHRRPLLAGAILGVLVIKPQFAPLVPLCLLAGGHWRALLAMAGSATVLALASAYLLGIGAWAGFFLHTRPMLTAMLEQPFQGLPMQGTFASAFMAARSLGASLRLAYAFQGIVSLACALGAWRLWRTPVRDPILLAAATALLAMVAAPWVHSYDMIPLAAAIVVLVGLSAERSQLLLGFAWFWPGAVVLLPIPMALSMASTACVACIAWREAGTPSDRSAGIVTDAPSVIVHGASL